MHHRDRTEQYLTGFWDPAVETADRASIERLQSERLREQVAYVHARAPFFQETFAKAGVRGSDVRRRDDLTALPTFDKDQLRAFRERTGDPWAGTLCVPASKLTVTIHSTGTSGRPNLYGLTESELDTVGDIFARAAFTAGLRPGDHTIFPGTTMWHGAFVGWHEAFQRMGVVKHVFGGQGQTTVIGQTLEMAPDLDAITALFVYSPEAEIGVIQGAGVSVRETFPALRLIWSAADASPARRRMAEDFFGVPFCNQYGSGDQFWMTGECPDNPGQVHVPEDRIVFEVLDPDSLAPVPSGGTGLLHITNLWSESFPYLRYNMEDMVTHDDTPCSCGRTSKRIVVKGRLAWSLRIPDGFVFSQDVEAVLWEDDALAGRTYQIVRARQQPQESVVVHVVRGGDAAADTAGAAAERLRATFGVPFEVRFVGEDEIVGAGQGGKPVRVVDEPS